MNHHAVTQGHHHNHHGHMWLVGVLGMAAGLVLLIYVPSLAAVSRSILLFAGFHLVGGIVLLASLYATAGRPLARKWPLRTGNKDRPAVETLDFGWIPAWTTGPWIASLVAAAAAVAIQVAVPGWWPLSMGLTLLAASFFAGYLITRSATRRDHSALPMVDLCSGPEDVSLDAGCGSGRTTIALGRTIGKGRIVALDRFDSDYIENGGRALLERNLRIAGLTGRVAIERGDITAMPFPDRSFDSAVSAHAMDHLGEKTAQGLREVFRVLKPGGRFLLVVWVPGWTMFAVANVLSFFLTPARGWKHMAREAGFALADEGTFNGMKFLLLERPGERNTVRP